MRELFGDNVEWRTLERDVLEITAFDKPRGYGEHFKARYGPTIAARANARRTERDAEFDEALDRFCDEWNRGTPDRGALREGVPAGGGHADLTIGRGALLKLSDEAQRRTWHGSGFGAALTAG